MDSFVLHRGLLINERFLPLLKDLSLADFMALRNIEGGTLLKRNRYRSVMRLEFEMEGRKAVFFLKRHFWPLRARMRALLPLLRKEDARNEWKNMILLDELGFSTMTPVAFGEERRFGVPFFSLTLTEGIQDAEKIEEYLPRRFSPPLTSEGMEEKRAFIAKIACLARDFHGEGLNHQDFYLGHLFFSPSEDRIYIIDIQRVHCRKKIRAADRIKDLAQMASSAKGIGVLSGTDLMRFFLVYLGKDRLTGDDKRLARQVLRKVRRIQRHTVKLLARRKKRA